MEAAQARKHREAEVKKRILVLLGAALLVSVASASEFKNGFPVGQRSHSGQIVGGWYDVDSTGRYLLFDSNGRLRVIEDAKDRDLDFGVTNLISSVAIDSGGTGGANFRYSAPLDVRKWTKGNIIIHITAASAVDTAGKYQYGVTVFPLTSATLDWTTLGVPVSTNVGPAATDTLGFQYITPNAIAPMQGERVVTLSTDRTTSNYANINAGQTVSLPWDVWLGTGAKPRYIAVQIRLMSRNYTVAAMNLVPSVRVDVEGLR